MYLSPLWANIVVTISLPPATNELQLTVKAFGSCNMDNLPAPAWFYPRINLLGAFMGKTASDNGASASYN
jgi:hypothetical protein